MSNQFYDYLTNKLEEYFVKQGLISGKEYNIQLDKEKQVEDMYNSICDSQYAQNFEDNDYKTKYLLFDKTGLVIAATIGDFKTDYLVTLRNNIESQDGKWKDKALLHIFHRSKDSIDSGSLNLFVEGMPFCSKTIQAGLLQEVYSSSLSQKDQAILEFDITRKQNENENQNDLWVFEGDLAAINRGTIDNNMMMDFGLFNDSCLSQYNKAKMLARLADNYNRFKEVKIAHEYGSVDEKLSKMYDSTGYQKLKSESEWFKTDYKIVHDSFEKSKSQKALDYINTKTKGDVCHIFERNSSDTTAGQRKKSILVFNEDALDTIELNIKFDSNLKRVFIGGKCKNFCSVSGKVLSVNLDMSTNKIQYFKVIYTHENMTKSKYEFDILVVPFKREKLLSIEKRFLINSSKKILSLTVNDEPLEFGCGADRVDIQDIHSEEVITVNENESKCLSQGVLMQIEDALNFQLQIEGCDISCVLSNVEHKPAPISCAQICKRKREKQTNFVVNGNKVSQKSFEAYYGAESEIAQIIKRENQIIQDKILYGKIGVNGIESEEIQISSNVKIAYLNLLSVFSDGKTCPLLSYVDDSQQLAIESFINEYIKSLETIESPFLSEEQKNLFKLGMVVNGDTILLSPFHILSMAYRLSMQLVISDEILPNSILNRLNPVCLVPYIYFDNNTKYRVIYENDKGEWLTYKKCDSTEQLENDNYLSSVVFEKLNQFVKFFDFLFLGSSSAPIKINAINLGANREFLCGLFEFVRHRADKYGIENVCQIEVEIYQQNYKETAFEEFSILTNLGDFSKVYPNQLKSKLYSEHDLLNLYHSTIRYYKHSDTGKDYSYAHISFYNNNTVDDFAKDNMKEIMTAISLGGMVSGVSSITRENGYRSGFGARYLDEETTMGKLSVLLNELVSSLENDAKNPYKKGESIVCTTSTYSKETLDSLFDSSFWVTFINPKVNLEFFSKVSNELLIIHYDDQLSSSSGYDAITVTKKSKQFREIFKQELQSKNVQTSDIQVDSAIKIFNSINGEWLLDLVDSTTQKPREKISMTSAVKYMLSFLKHDNIVWVPISLEEILRISGNVKLPFFEGAFTVKSLGQKGPLSDDILMIGIEKRNGNVFIHYYPVEVKIGVRNPQDIEKGKNQVLNLHKLFEDKLLDYQGEELFIKKYYRNFFIQILLINCQKMFMNGLLSQESLSYVNDNMKDILNDNYTISKSLEKFLGFGSVVAFKNDNNWRSMVIENDILILSLVEEDAYSGIVEGIDSITERIQSGKTDLRKEDLISTKYTFEVAKTFEEPANVLEIDAENADTNEGSNSYMDDEEEEAEITGEVETEELDEEQVETKMVASDTAIEQSAIEQIRIPIGIAEGSNKIIYWEYGNSKLANRHMLIVGKSGQGKSYFIQCVLIELHKVGISSLIIDYTDGFKKPQLEAEFKDYLGEDLVQFIVAKDKFPLNPFKRNIKELDEDEYMEEDSSDVAERIQSIFDAIYKFGPQQANCIYQATKRGLEKYGEKMTLQRLREELEEDKSSNAKTTLSRLALLFDKDPFVYDSEFNWSQLDDKSGKVFIVQLTNFTEEVQLVITEFILWDLWYYKLKNGSKNIPMPIVLDEAQNLNHNDKSPSAKILTEGRKFGWSGIYATQFLKGAMENDEIKRLENSGHKIYFLTPDSEISLVAASLSKEPSEKKQWERKITMLQKGQCISYGMYIDNEGKSIGDIASIVNITSLKDRI